MIPKRLEIRLSIPVAREDEAKTRHLGDLPLVQYLWRVNLVGPVAVEDGHGLAETCPQACRRRAAVVDGSGQREQGLVGGGAQAVLACCCGAPGRDGRFVELTDDQNDCHGGVSFLVMISKGDSGGRCDANRSWSPGTG